MWLKCFLFSKISVCNNIQNRATRIFLAVNNFSPNAGIQEDMGWNLPVTRRRLRMIKYWNRLVYVGDTRRQE